MNRHRLGILLRTGALGIATASLSSTAVAQSDSSENPWRLHEDARVRVSVDAPTDSAPAADTAVLSPSPTPLGMSTAVDERALRAHAARFDYEQVDAEIRRLRAQHPGWEPPTDLFAPGAAAPPQVDERPLWELYEAEDYDAVRREIEVLRQVHPGWEPPSELMALIRRHEARSAILAAVAAEGWQEIILRYELEPDLFDCDQIENAWSAAEAYFHTAQVDQTYRIYGDLMAHCDADLRLSTLQKALANRDDGSLEALFAMEESQSRSPDQEERFAQISRDFRGEPWVAVVSTGGGRRHDPAITRIVNAYERGDMAAVVSMTGTSGRDGPTEMLLRGWALYRLGRTAEAVQAFRAAQGGDDEVASDAAYGLTLAQLDLGLTEDARQTAGALNLEAGQQAELDRTLLQQQANDAYRRGEYERTLALITAVRRADPGDQSLAVIEGWSHYNLGNYDRAEAIFERLVSAGQVVEGSRGLELSRAAQRRDYPDRG